MQNCYTEMVNNLFAKFETFHLVDSVENHLHQWLHLLHVSQAIS